MIDVVQTQIVVRVFGPFSVGFANGQKLRLSSGRQQALIALLVSAPDMKRTRGWLIDKLWSDTAQDRARANLRQLLHATRQSFGETFDDIFETTSESVALRSTAVTVHGQPTDGEFLEGFDLPLEGFEEWLRDQRLSGGGRLATRSQPSEALLPRITVLPFMTIGDGPTTLGDCLAHEITSVFARSQMVEAVSYYSARSVTLGQASLDVLNADLTLAGHCRLVDDHLTLDLSLEETANATTIWSDRYQVSLKSVLAGEDHLADRIVGDVIGLVMSRSLAKSLATPLSDLSAYVMLLAAVHLMHSFNRQHFERAGRHLVEVIKRVPRHAVPHAWLAQWYLLRLFQKWSPAAKEDHAAAKDAVHRALDHDPSCPLSLAIDGNIATVLDHDFARAEQRFAAAMCLNPSSAMIRHLASVLATSQADGPRALDLTESAYRLSPRDPRKTFFDGISAGCHVAGGRYSRAIDLAEAALQHNPLHLSAHRSRVIALQLDGQAEAAHQAAQKLLELDPDFRVGDYLNTHPAAATVAGKSWAHALGDAGIPYS